MRRAYVVLLVVFYVSVALGLNAHFAQLAGWVAAVLREDAWEMQVLFARVIAGLWTVTFVASMAAWGPIRLPFRLVGVSLALSGMLLSCSIGPILLFGRAWPPRPF
jgi:hypothetical protein